MPKCIVDYCRNYAGMKKNEAHVILHGFPTTLDRIKLWLRAIEQSGQIFDNLDEMADRIWEGKRFDSYRVCSQHFTIQCYFVNGDKKILKKESIPTVFADRHAVVPCVPKKIRRRREPLTTLAKKQIRKKATESLKENKEAPKLKKKCRKKTRILKNGQELAQKILNLTLEIISLLTGEDYIVVKKSCPQVKLDRRIQCSKMVPQSRMLDWVNEHKILELSKTIIELLTREKQNNIEGHAAASTDIRMENPQTVPLHGVFLEADMAHPWLSCSSTVGLNTVIVQDFQECKSLKISTWTTTSEANGKNELVLLEDGIVQNPTAQGTEEMLLSGEDYSQHMWTVDEALPHRRGIWPPTHHTQCPSIGMKESSQSESIILPHDYMQQNILYMGKELETSKRNTLTEMDITGQNVPRHIREDTESLLPLDKYTSIIIKEEPLSPLETHAHKPANYTATVHPLSPALMMSKEPSYIDQRLFSHTSVCMKEDPDSCVEESNMQSPMYSDTSSARCIAHPTS